MRKPGSRPDRNRLARVLVRAAFPLIGVALLGHALVRSLGGDARHLEIVLGIACIALTFSARLIPRR